MEGTGLPQLYYGAASTLLSQLLTYNCSSTRLDLNYSSFA